MTVAELKNQIAECEASIQTQRDAFPALRREIVASIKPFVKDNLKSAVESEVRRNAEHTKGLGQSALSEMKKKFNELLENSDSLVESIFDDDSLWIHVNYAIINNGDRWGQEYNNKKAASTNIHKGIALALGNAGHLLHTYEYIKIGGTYCWENGMRRDYTHPNKNSPRLICRNVPRIPDAIEQLIEEYCNRVVSLHEVLSKDFDLHESLSEQEASDLWDNA